MTAGRWQDLALCKGQTDLFFPAVGEGRLAHEAVAICKRCPVTERCLQTALEQNETFGVWGAHTANQRTRIPKRRPLQPCGTRAAYSRGCRCEPCLKARTSYSAIWRETAGPREERPRR